MLKKTLVHPNFRSYQNLLDRIISNYEEQGEPFGNQDRNSLKLFDLDGLTINVKSFKVPNIINQIAYRFFRKSKAQRSFEFANKLIDFNIGTPKPIAYYEFTTPFLFKQSYYISEHQDYDITYRELTTDFDLPNYEDILRAFTRFTFNLHENGILFLDHSPGNTLIKINNTDYKFYLVDLNRMEFKVLDFKTRIKNFSKLTIYRFMVEIMSDEYAKCINEDYDKVFKLMWAETQDFQKKYYKNIRLKSKIKFWKK